MQPSTVPRIQEARFSWRAAALSTSPGWLCTSEEGPAPAAWWSRRRRGRAAGSRAGRTAGAAALAGWRRGRRRCRQRGRRALCRQSRHDAGWAEVPGRRYPPAAVRTSRDRRISTVIAGGIKPPARKAQSTSGRAAEVGRCSLHAPMVTLSEQSRSRVETAVPAR